MQALTSSELVARIKASEPGAEDILVQRFASGIAAILRRTTTDSSLIEDLSQETFSVVIQKLRKGDLREPEKLAGFVCSVARNLSIGHFRKKQDEKLQDLDENLPAVHTSPTQLDQVLAKEQAQLVRQVLRELDSRRDREILYRFYVEEEDKELICTNLDLSALHFNRVIHRARQRYKELYERRMAKK